MSRRISAFTAAVPTPLTLRDITLIWPAMPNCVLLVQSLTFPTEEFEEVRIPVGGTQVSMPTHVYKPGTWTFEVPDNVDARVRYELVNAYYNQGLHDIGLLIGNNVTWSDFSQSGGVDSTMISAVANQGVNVSTGVILCRAYIKSIGGVDFSKAASATEAVKWRVTVAYNYISKFSFTD